jgi:hypothetical protein
MMKNLCSISTLIITNLSLLLFLLFHGTQLNAQVTDPPGNIIMQTDSSGAWNGANVGIGVEKPKQALDVAGKIKVHNMDSIFSEHPVVIWDENDSTFHVISLDSLTNIIQKYRTYSNTPFGTWVRDTANGQLHQAKIEDKVGIGTTDPTEQLEITGNFKLPASTDSSGIIFKDEEPWVHNFHHEGTAGHNLFIGKNSGNFILEGSDSGSTGSYNTSVGDNSLSLITTGQLNTAIGNYTLNSNTSGSYNVAIGYNALNLNETGSYNTAVGMFALRNPTNANAITAVGYNALHNLTTGCQNTAVGQNSMVDCTSGVQNTALGSGALKSLTIGYANVAIGVDAMVFSKDSAVTNVAIGNSALSNSNRACNVAVGSSALKELKYGLDCIGIGTGAQLNNIYGNENIGVGVYTMNDKISGDANTVVGQYAMWKNVYGATNTTIGNRTGYWNTGSGNVFIGDSAAYFETGSDKLYIDNTPTDKPLIYGDFTDDQITINGNLEVTGNTNITGEIEFGTSYWNYLTFDANPTMQTQPGRPAFNYNELGLMFPKDSSAQVFISTQILRNWETGSELKPSLHYIQTSEDDFSVWIIKYRCYQPGDNIPSWNYTTSAGRSITYTGGSIHQVELFPEIDLSDFTEAPIIDMILYRDADEGTEGEILIKQFELKFKANKL